MVAQQPRHLQSAVQVVQEPRCGVDVRAEVLVELNHVLGGVVGVGGLLLEASLLHGLGRVIVVGESLIQAAALLGLNAQCCDIQVSMAGALAVELAVRAAVRRGG